MCEPTTILFAVGLVLTAAGGVQQAKSAKAAANYEAEVAENNAKTAQAQATHAQQLGNIEEERQRQRVRIMLGKQRTSFAANNVESTSGTALDMLSETAQMGEEDALAIRANAARSAWGYQVDAGNSVARSRLSRATGKNQATGTYLGTAANMANMSYNYARA